jgi:hypothetical protein
VIEIHLEDYEIEMATEVGIRRQREAERQGKKDRYGFRGDPYKIHIAGAIGELAVAKGLQVYWGGTVNTWGDADIGSRIQVRTRPDVKGRGELIVRPKDNPDDVFVLALGTAPDFKLPGWIAGKDAMKKKWLKDYAQRPPAYFVPHESLNDWPLPEWFTK